MSPGFNRNSILLSLTLLTLTINAVFAFDLAQVAVGTAAFQVEVARTANERAQGLMFRHELPPDRGMLFIQPPGPAVFWMKNTLISLDLLYFDTEDRLTQIVARVPPCQTPDCPLYPSEMAKIRYILEIRAGAAAQHHIQVGDRLRLEPKPRP